MMARKGHFKYNTRHAPGIVNTKMFRTEISAQNGQLILTLPDNVVEAWDLQEGQEVTISVKTETLVISRADRLKYSLAELLAATDPTALEAARDQEWFDSAPVGKELI